MTSQVQHPVMFNGMAYAQGVVAFFHPNASGGGGGERVLWCVDPSEAFFCARSSTRQGEYYIRLNVSSACACRAAIKAVQETFPLATARCCSPACSFSCRGAEFSRGSEPACALSLDLPLTVALA